MAFYTCEVVRAGHSGDQPGGGVIMQLKDVKTNKFDWTWFGYQGTKEKEILATALAALTADMLVVVGIEASTVPPPDWTPIMSIVAANRETIGW